MKNMRHQHLTTLCGFMSPQNPRQPSFSPHRKASSFGYLILVSLILTFIEIYSTQVIDYRLHRWEPQLGHRQRRQLSPNEWSQWGSWSLCSSTCGGGAAFRVRSCFRFSQRDDCSGDPRQYKACNVQFRGVGVVDMGTRGGDMNNILELKEYEWIIRLQADVAPGIEYGHMIFMKILQG
ncbi:ADAMTS-like protein 3 [Protopterus annectens]|uniref:ADAMTS-like protein 3 n=1 Tax=Protopterus annectens TaxID=7888 RepID=UPI001CFAADD9|nr:ADAMTS-like protein 3 [Protopterus annectens]